MNDILRESRFNFVSHPDKAFMLAFNDEMTRLGYDFGQKIGSGYCWGNYMVIYTRAGVKSKQVYARIYIREPRIVLRLFFNDIDRHRAYIENAPDHILEVFTGEQGACQHDRDDGDGKCKFRKTYRLEDRLIEKCNGITFEFHEPSIQKLPDYIDLFTEFYPNKKIQKPVGLSATTQ